MNRTPTLARLGIAGALLLGATASFAQDVHFTQFDASPLIVNPAFTGGFNGTVRAAAIYRDQWRSITPNAFRTYGVSVDAPILRDLSIDDYLAAGVQLYNDRAGDGNLNNTSVLASIAYHKFLGGTSSYEANKTLTVGLQGGYTSKNIDLSRLYFQDQFLNGQYTGPSAEFPGLGNRVNYFTVNAGIAWSHSPSENFGYTLGVGANNLNQPRESFQQKKNSDVGLGRRYTAQAGAIWRTSDRFSIRPGILYQSQSTAYELVAGSEFNYIVGDPEERPLQTAVFAGLWTRVKDAYMVTAGVEFKAIRIGVAYDYNTSDLKNASNHNGGFEISLRYILPADTDFGPKLSYPCTRF